MTNSALAERLLAEARPLMARRRALLSAASVLTATGTIAAAIKEMSAWDGPGEVRDAAIAILREIRREEP